MIFSAPNQAYNITIGDATAFLGVLTKLGFVFGPLHLNGQTSGASEADYVPLSEVADLDGATAYNCIAKSGGDWHNVAMLRALFGPGGIHGTRLVFTSVNPGQTDAQFNAQLMGLPGASAAIETIIKGIAG